jgi:hypothetical protein
MSGGKRPGGRAPGGRGPAGRTLVSRFRALYGASPANLLILLASFAVCGYAAARLLERNWFDVAKWVVLAALLHDLVLVPLYAVTDWALHKALGTPRPEPQPELRPESRAELRPGPRTESRTESRSAPRTDARIAAVNHIRVPAFLSLLLLLVYWPLISRAKTNYRLGTALDPDVFLGRWVLITAVLFAASGLIFVLRWWRGVRRPG